jgi:3-deoxy-7-phosphoheptulonate synthase
MIVWLRKEHTAEQLEEVLRRIRETGCRPDVSEGTESTVIGLIGETKGIDENVFQELPWVERTIRITRPYKLVSREYQPASRRIKVGDMTIGDGSVTIIAGPCSVEGMDMLLELSDACRVSGAQMLRGGAYKPRTSPYAFQGLGREGIRCLVEARRRTGLPIVTEATGNHHHQGPSGEREDRTVLEEVALNTDILQIGTRNMKSYGFLEDVARVTGERKVPVLLKRGESATLEEFLLAAEYLVVHGNPDVILCLRGIRAYDAPAFLRYSPDIGLIPVLKHESNLPVVFDPSHATGDRRYVRSTALAAVAAGADGLLIETHLDPEKAWSDGKECVTPASLRAIVDDVRRIEAVRSADLVDPVR